MNSWGSYDNTILFAHCQNLNNLRVRLDVTTDFLASDGGFSMQLNAYPPPGQLAQGQTLTWFQYIIYITGEQISYEIQYWANNAPGAWPAGYNPVPNTTPWLPVIPNDYYLTQFGSGPANCVAADSWLEIALATSADGAVESATFTATDPAGHSSASTFTFPAGGCYPICAFELDLVGPGNFANASFGSGAGMLTYSVEPGQLAIQQGGAGAACGEFGGGTGETSNAAYGGIEPFGATLRQPVIANNILALHGIWATDNSQHVVYVDDHNHALELSYVPGLQGWSAHDLTAETHSTPAARTSAMASYQDLAGGGRHVDFVDAQGHVRELYCGPGAAGWSSFDLTAETNAPTAVVGGGLDSYPGPDGSQHVNFLDADGHVHELYFNPATQNWACFDLTAQTSGSIAFPFSRLSGYWAADSTQHIYYSDLAGGVHELYFNPTTRRWYCVDLTALTSARPASVMAGLSGYGGGAATRHVAYVDITGHVHEFFFNPMSRAWTSTDLTALTIAPRASVFSQVAAYPGPDGSRHVSYLDDAGHITALSFNPIAMTWSWNDLIGETKGTPAQPASGLDGYSGADGSLHVNYADDNGNVRELYLAPNETRWNDYALTTLT